VNCEDVELALGSSKRRRALELALWPGYQAAVRCAGPNWLPWPASRDRTW